MKVQSRKGKTALDMARSRGMADVIAFLKTCGKFPFSSYRILRLAP